MRFYYYWVAVLVLVLDFVTKKLIETKLEIGDQISIIGNFFSSLRIEIAVLHLASCKSKDCFYHYYRYHCFGYHLVHTGIEKIS